MTAPLLLYRMVRDYIKMNEITNKILYFPLNLFFNLKFPIKSCTFSEIYSFIKNDVLSC